jgi:hypothetical protein
MYKNVHARTHARPALQPTSDVFLARMSWGWRRSTLSGKAAAGNSRRSWASNSHTSRYRRLMVSDRRSVTVTTCGRQAIHRGGDRVEDAGRQTCCYLVSRGAKASPRNGGSEIAAAHRTTQGIGI